MKWPSRITLRTQILVPVVGVLVLTIGALGLVNAWLAAANKQREIEMRIQTVADTITRVNFPLTAPIAAQIKELVDADLLVQHPDGAIVLATAESLPQALPTVSEVAVLRRGEMVQSSLGEFWRATVAIRAADGKQHWLHIYYPKTQLVRLRWQAIVPAIWVAGGALAVAGLFSAWFAERISRPIRALREKTQQIAAGDFRPIAWPPRADELGDLTNAVNQLAQQLDRFQLETQQAERHRTLAQLGASLAHQLRNFATGAQLALELHRERCGQDPESLQMALRQLQMIEQYLGKLLRLGSAERVVWESVDLRASVTEVLQLLEPKARHAGVELARDLAEDVPRLRGDRDGLHQLILNLVTNAIEAAAAQRVYKSTPMELADAVGGQPPEHPTVRVGVRVESSDQLVLTVADSGAGPAAAISARMFEPLVTDKPDGAGLGLSLVERVVRQHQGAITWTRYNDWTEFHVTFPIQPPLVSQEPPPHVPSVDRR